MERTGKFGTSRLTNSGLVTLGEQSHEILEVFFFTIQLLLASFPSTAWMILKLTEFSRSYKNSKLGSLQCLNHRGIGYCKHRRIDFEFKLIGKYSTTYKIFHGISYWTAGACNCWVKRTKTSKIFRNHPFIKHDLGYWKKLVGMSISN